MLFSTQLAWLLILPLGIACISWTVTHEEIFSEPRKFCQARCSDSQNFLTRKFFYAFTCEYCFSHYVTIFFLCITRYHLLLDDWRGYLIACFSFVWIANVYVGLFALFRLVLKKGRKEVESLQRELPQGSNLKK
jgi:hypothetical protein